MAETKRGANGRFQAGTAPGPGRPRGGQNRPSCDEDRRTERLLVLQKLAEPLELADIAHIELAVQKAAHLGVPIDPKAITRDQIEVAVKIQQAAAQMLLRELENPIPHEKPTKNRQT